jgi:hypothetical protein
LAETALPWVEAQLAREWSAIVRHLAAFDPHRAASLLGRALLSDGVGLPRQAERSLEELASEQPDAVMNGLGNALLDSDNGWRLQVCVLRDVVGKIPTPCVMAWIEKHGIDAARALARHLPQPYVDDAGNPVVPVTLDTILRTYDDDRLFESFVMGTHSGESWWGNASERMRREARDAQKFLRHPNHRIREWAKYEVEDRMQWADREERDHVERFLPP